MFRPIRFPASPLLAKTTLVLAAGAMFAAPILLLPRGAARPAGFPAARLHSHDIRARAAAFCLTLGPDPVAVGQPYLFWQRVPARCGGRTRRLWSVECSIGDRGLTLVFNDVTGNIESLFADSQLSAPSATDVPVVSLSMAVEAEQVAIRRLQDLKMVPPGSRLSLAEAPSCDRSGTTWRIDWNVTPRDAAAYEVKMLLDARDARPLYVANYGELGRSETD